MPASSRSATPPSSASAAIRPGLLAKYGIINEPVLALLVAGVVAAALGFVTSFLVLRGSDLTRLMVTLGIALLLGELGQPLFQHHRRRRRAAGHRASRRSSACSASTCSATPATSIASSCCSSVFCSRGASCIRRSACRCASLKGNPLRASAIGIPVNRRLIAIYTVSGGLCRHRRRAAHPDHRVLLARRVLVRALGRPAAGADHRRHRLSLWRPDRRRDLQIPAGLDRQPDAAILAVLDRLRAGRDRAGRPRARRIAGRRVRAAICRFGKQLAGAPGAGRRSPRRRDIEPCRSLRNDRAGKALRRPRRRARRVADDREGRAPRADRAERRRQDDGDQSAHRRAAADRRPHPARRQRHHRRCARISACGAAWRAPSRSTSCSSI